MGEEVKRRNKAAPVNGSALPLGTSMQDIMELALRDQILELEEKIFVGALGFLKSAKEEKLRSTWRNSIETKSYRMLAEHLEWGEDGRLEAKDLEDEEGGLVKQMAAAILQVEQMISTEDIEKYLKEPLGEGEKERKKRQKKEEEREKRKAKAEEAEEVKRRNKAAPVNGSALPLGTSMQDIMELALRYQILELEEKIFGSSWIFEVCKGKS